MILLKTARAREIGFNDRPVVDHQIICNELSTHRVSRSSSVKVTMNEGCNYSRGSRTIANC